MALQKKCRHAKAQWFNCECAWYVAYRENGKQKYLNVGSDFKEAHRRSQLDPHRRVDASDHRFSTLAARWLLSVEGQLAPNSYRSYDVCLNKANEFVGQLQVSAITAGTVLELEGSLTSDGYSAKYIGNVRLVIRQVLQFSEDLKIIKSVPQFRRRKAVARKKQVKHLEPKQIKALLSHMPSEYRSILMFGYLTGLRPSELLAVNVHDMDIPNKRYHVRTQLAANGKITERLKTPSSNRYVDLSPGAIALLPTPSPDGRYWPTNYNTLKSRWKVARDKAGLPSEGLGLQALRHSYASLLILNGDPITYVAAQLGHANPNITLGIYSHLMERPSRDASALDRLIAAMG